MDLVVNHTSDLHPWFMDALHDPDSRYHNWYVWSKERPRDWDKGMVFPGVQKETWTYSPEADKYYYHRFYNFEPNLNSQNPNVQAYVKKVMAYWLGLGVDGFRMDAVPFLIEISESGILSTQHDFKMLTDLHGFITSQKPDAIMLGEANVTPDEDKDYFGEDGQRLNMMFNFDINQYLFYALATSNAAPLAQALKDTNNKPAVSQWANFLRNHDEVDLGRLSWMERQRVFRAFGPQQNMQLYKRGIRRRLAPMLSNDKRKLELAYSLEFALPGTPVLRYGDEIGMGDDLDLKERLAVRTPMQWSNAPNGGFTNGGSFRPVITQGTFGKDKVNVADEQRDPESLLNWMTNLIAIRKKCLEIGMGEAKILNTSSVHVLAIEYSYQGNFLLTIFNLSQNPQNVVIQTNNKSDMQDLFNNHAAIGASTGAYRLLLRGYGFSWYRTAS